MLGGKTRKDEQRRTKELGAPRNSQRTRLSTKSFVGPTLTCTKSFVDKPVKIVCKSFVCNSLQAILEGHPPRKENVTLVDHYSADISVLIAGQILPAECARVSKLLFMNSLIGLGTLLGSLFEGRGRGSSTLRASWPVT